MGVAGLSASYNGYGYAHGNPATYTDPSGKCVWEPGVDLISCGLENAGLLLGQIGSLFSTTHQYADEAWQASWQETWANGFEGYVDLQLASLRDLIDFTLLVGVPMFFPPGAVIVTGTDLAQSWAEGTLKPIDVLLFAAGLGKFGQMATIRSVEEEIARNIIRAEQRNSERIFSNDFQIGETGRIRVGRGDQADFGASLRVRRAWPATQWRTGEPPAFRAGIYEYVSQNDPQRRLYVGMSSHLRKRLKIHLLEGDFTDWNEVRYLVLDLNTPSPSYWLRVAERTRMYQLSSGDINRLANIVWPANEVPWNLYNLPLLEGWPEELSLPQDPAFYEVLMSKQR